MPFIQSTRVISTQKFEYLAIFLLGNLKNFYFNYILECGLLARGLAHEIHIVEGARYAQRGPVCGFRDGHERSEKETRRLQGPDHCTLQVRNENHLRVN